MSAGLDGARGAEGDVAAVTTRWRAGDLFGVLLHGDPLHAEELFRALALTSHHAYGHAEAVTPEHLSAAHGARVVALAWDVTDVHPALLRRCTAVLDCQHAPGREGAERSASRALEAGAVRRRPDDEVAEEVLLVLHAAGVHDHGLDVAAVRLAHGLAASGCTDPSGVVRRVVAQPRAAASPADPGGGGAGADGDDVEPEEGPAAPEDGPSTAAADGPSAGGVDEQDGEDGGNAEDGDGSLGAAAPQPGAGVDLPSPDPAGRAGPAGPVTTVDPVAAQRAPLGDGLPPGTAAPVGDGVERPVDGGSDGPTELAHRFDGDGDLPDDGGGPSSGPSGPARDGGAQDAAPPGPPTPRDEAAVRAVLTPRRPPGGRPAPRHLRGRRGATSLSTDHGPVVRVVSLERAAGRVAVVPSLRRAARRSASAGAAGPVPTGAARGEGGMRLHRDDLRGVLRRRRGGTHTVVVLDRSSSLGASGLRRAGSAADQVLAQVAAQRGVVSVVVAAGARASLVVDASTSLARARAALRAASSGGGTPLADAVRIATEHLAPVERGRRRVVLLTDGRPTVSLAGRGAPEERLTAELATVLAELVRAVPDVGLVPLGAETGAGAARARAPFLAAGVRLFDGR